MDIETVEDLLDRYTDLPDAAEAVLELAKDRPAEVAPLRAAVARVRTVLVEEPDGTADTFLVDLLRDAMREVRNSEEEEFQTVCWPPWGRVLEYIHGDLLEPALAYATALYRLSLVRWFPPRDLFGARIGVELRIAGAAAALRDKLTAAGETAVTIERYLAELRRSGQMCDEQVPQRRRASWIQRQLHIRG